MKLVRGSRAVCLFLLLGGPSACSAPDDEAKGDASLTAADLPRIRAEADQQARAPGDMMLTVPSSLPGVTSWSVYLGVGITAIGTSSTGRRAAVLAWLTDAQDHGALACETASSSSAEACTAALEAFHRDVAPSAKVAPADLHPLGTGDVGCPEAIGVATDHALASSTTADGQERWTAVPPMGITMDGQEKWFVLPVAGQATAGTRASCCKPQPGQLVGTTCTLLASGDPTADPTSPQYPAAVTDRHCDPGDGDCVAEQLQDCNALALEQATDCEGDDRDDPAVVKACRDAYATASVECRKKSEGR